MTLAAKAETWEHVFPGSEDWTQDAADASAERASALDAAGRRVIFVSAPACAPPAASRLNPPHRQPASVSARWSTIDRQSSKGSSTGALSSTLRAESVAARLRPRSTAPASEVVDLAAKRTLDIVGSLFGLVVLSPLMIAVACLVRLTSRGPAIYAHERVGQNGRKFVCYKFRTMGVDAEAQKAKLVHLNTHDDDRTFKIRNDPRVTRLGRFLRIASIDELPQLLNVLRGEMSLVGPRPALPNEVALYSPLDSQRLAVKPGLTCIWQVSGRSKLAFPEQVRLDLEYVEKRSLWLDLKLIALTIPAVCFTDGAY